MRILISADIEGISGVMSPDQTRPGSAAYERARLLMTREVNAAVEGALDGGATEVSPVSARDAVAAGVLATRSLRSGSVPFDVPELDAELADYFHRGQHNSHSPTESS